MAKKRIRRDGNIEIRKDIKIERNVIENFLMNVRDFIKDKRKIVLFSLTAFILLCVLVIGGYLYISNKKIVQLVRFEEIMDEYEKYKNKDNNIRKKTIEKLLILAGSSYSGFVKEISYYIAGNLYYDSGDLKSAKDYLIKYADESSSSMFSALALQKAAAALEEMKDLDSAMKLYKKLELKFADAVIADQVLYSIGRIYSKKGKVKESVRYFNRVISSYPRSLFAEKAKKRLFLIGFRK